MYMKTYPMLALDVRALIRNRFKVSRPTSNTYTFKKRIQPVIAKKARVVYVKATHFSVIA